ncbi:MAG: DUF6261 family protein [Myxococcota bacterium]
MPDSVSQWFRIYQFPGGRREFALSQLARLAEQQEWTELAQHAQAAVEHEQQLRDMQRTLVAARSRGADPRLSELDPAIDRTIGSIFRIAGESATTLAGTEDGERARVLLERVFPEGAVAITSMSYVEQSREVHSILGLLQGELSEQVAALGLGAFVSRLATLNAEFSEALDADPSPEVTRDQVRAAKATGQLNLVGALAMILGRHWRSTDEDVEARRTLLRPITTQNEAIRSYLRQRRSVQDVDPTTGQVQGGDEEEGEGEGQAPPVPSVPDEDEAAPT